MNHGGDMTNVQGGREMSWTHQMYLAIP